MAAINFARSDRNYEKFIKLSHIIAAGLCVVLLAFTVFHSSHFIFTPPVFLAAAFIFGVDAYDTVRGKDRNKKKMKPFLFNFVLTVFCLALSALSVIFFWF